MEKQKLDCGITVHRQVVAGRLVSWRQLGDYNRTVLMLEMGSMALPSAGYPVAMDRMAEQLVRVVLVRKLPDGMAHKTAIYLPIAAAQEMKDNLCELYQLDCICHCSHNDDRANFLWCDQEEKIWRVQG